MFSRAVMIVYFKNIFVSPSYLFSIKYQQIFIIDYIYADYI